MQATVIIHLAKRRQKANGGYPVKLQITFRRVKKFYSTGVDMTEDEFNSNLLKKELKQRSDKIQYYFKKAESICKDLLDAFTFEEFGKRFLSKKQGDIVKVKSSNYLTLLDNAKKEFDGQQKYKSRDSYVVTINKLKEFLGSDQLPLRDVTAAFLHNFERYMLK